MEQELSDKVLLGIALAISFFGVAALIFFSLIIPENKLLDYYNADGKVHIEGRIMNYEYRNNNTFMKIEYACIVDTVAFHSSDKNALENMASEMHLVNGSMISVEGTIQEYKGKKSIVAEKISVLNRK